MSDLMREEFEIAFVARCKKKGEVARLDRLDDGRYEYLCASDAWWGWKASRECLVIEIPKSDAGQYWDDDDFDFCKYEKDVVSAAHAAGVKTK